MKKRGRNFPPVLGPVSWTRRRPGVSSRTCSSRHAGLEPVMGLARIDDASCLSPGRDANNEIRLRRDLNAFTMVTGRRRGQSTRNAAE